MSKFGLIRDKNGSLSVVLRAKSAEIAHIWGLEYALLVPSHQFILAERALCTKTNWWVGN